MIGDISYDQFLLDLVNAETRGVVSKKQCKGFSVCVDGSANLSVGFFSMPVTCCFEVKSFR